jgi:hypothetical protein
MSWFVRFEATYLDDSSREERVDSRTSLARVEWVARLAAVVAVEAGEIILELPARTAAVYARKAS